MHFIGIVSKSVRPRVRVIECYLVYTQMLVSRLVPFVPRSVGTKHIVHQNNVIRLVDWYKVAHPTTKVVYWKHPTVRCDDLRCDKIVDSWCEPFVSPKDEKEEWMPSANVLLDHSTRDATIAAYTAYTTHKYKNFW